MPRRLHRYWRASSALYHVFCYRRLPLLRSARSRDRFLAVLEQTRRRYHVVVVGYVVMPEHIHLLISEPEVGTPSTVMQVLKQRTARALLPKTKRRDPRQVELFGEALARAPFWQSRFCLDEQETSGEAPLHASKSRNPRTGGGASGLALE